MNIRTKHLSVLILCGVFGVSCGGNASSPGTPDSDSMQTIRVRFDYPALDPVECVTDIECIPLETKDDNLLGNFRTPIITDSLILISNWDNNAIHIFDRKGKAIHTINRQGKGPQEYSYIQAVQLTPDGQIVVIDGSGKSALYYDLAGNFIRRKALPKSLKSSISGIGYLDREHLLLEIYDPWAGHRAATGEPDTTTCSYDLRSQVAIADSSFEIRQAFLPKQNPHQLNMVNAATLQRASGNSFYYTHLWCDTLYRIAPGKLEPAFHVDMSAVNGYSVIGPEISTVQELMKTAEGHTYFDGSLMDFDDVVLVFCAPAERKGMGIVAWDKRSGKTYSIARSKNENWLASIALIQSMVRCIHYKDRMFALIPAYVLLGKAKKEGPEWTKAAGLDTLVGDLSDNSNPVLISFRFRLPEPE